jgi:hypothetical protein
MPLTAATSTAIATAYYCNRKEQDRKRARQQSEFKDLLEDCIYRSDHVGMDWEAAKAKIVKKNKGVYYSGCIL